VRSSDRDDLLSSDLDDFEGARRGNLAAESQLTRLLLEGQPSTRGPYSLRAPATLMAVHGRGSGKGTQIRRRPRRACPPVAPSLACDRAEHLDELPWGRRRAP
jgi:hypothetical protein